MFMTNNVVNVAFLNFLFFQVSKNSDLHIHVGVIVCNARSGNDGIVIFNAYLLNIPQNVMIIIMIVI